MSGFGIVSEKVPTMKSLDKKRPVKSRVCGLPTCMVRQEYDKNNLS